MADEVTTGSETSSGSSGTTGGATTNGATTGSSAGGSTTKPEAGKAEAGKQASPAAATEGLVAAPPAYSPNYKYKVLKEEKEIPEQFRALVKSAEDEKMIRALFERHDGFPILEDHRNTMVQENKAMREQWGPVVEDAQRIVGYLNSGDLDSFFEELGVDETTVLKYALYRLQLKEKPELAQASLQTRNLAKENAELKRQLQTANAGSTHTAVQARALELDTALSSEQTLAAAKAFDSAVGKPGEFRAKCIMIGKMYAAQGIDAPVENVVQEALQLVGWQGKTAAQPAVATGTQVADGAGQTGLKALPTLPNLKGKGTSPAKRVFKTTDELREFAKTFGG